uniref:Uncharacterized protein n=1 Tax=Globodera rostochiensis TaxID=31243 RepID=A0A914I8S8_GLORO
MTKGPIVIAGGGLVGLSVAYNLAKRGARDVFLFERHCIGAHHSTRVSTGMINNPNFFADRSLQSIVRKSHELYAELDEHGTLGFTRCGRVYLASKPANSAAELIDCPSEMLSRWPMLATEDVKLALFSPLDAIVDVQSLCRLLTDRCRELGVHIHENVGVKRVLLNERRTTYAVDTDEGFIETGAFVNAAGIWANLVEVPELPDHQALAPPTQTKGAPEWHIPAPSWDHFATILRHLINRFPSMAQLSRGSLITGAEMYTPDIRPLIGESDQACGYFIINGMNGQGLSFAGGLGAVLAEWVLEGRAPSKTSAVVDKLDVTRFLPLHANPQYLFQRVPEVASNIFKNLSSSHQCHTARNLRTSPIHHHLRAAGAVFAETMGYERPLWYEVPAHSSGTTTVGSSDSHELRPHRQALFTAQDPLVGRPTWFPMVAKEYEACRESVGIVDMTSFAKFDISGPDVVPLLQKLCSANIDRPVGTTVYTGMHNEKGGYVSDATVSRMSNDSYFMVAPTIQQVRLALWVQRWVNEWAMDVRLQDVTNNFIALDIVGPASRDLMRALTNESVTPHDFPSFAFRTVHLGLVGPLRAISVSHCGELGWMLYIPNELVLNAYEQLVDAGTEHSLRHCGYYALRHLRIEKFYVYWGQDIDSMTTPVECGRVFRVDFEKDFIGKDALNRQLERGVSKRFVQLLVDEHDMDRDPWPHGDEPIFRDGALAGWTTTAAYGFTLGCQVCLGFVQNDQFGVSSEYLTRGTYEVELAGKRFPCRINLHSPSLPMISSEHPNHYRPTQ